MKRWMFIPLVLFVLGGIGAAGYFGFSSNQPVEEPVVEPPTVEVSRGDVVQSVTAPGALVDLGETTLQSRVNGQVEQIQVQPGNVVQKGQIVAVLGERQHYEAAVATARVTLIEAEAALDALKTGLPLAEARVVLAEAQKAYDKASRTRESKQYARSSQETIDIARANYVIAEDAVSRATELYDRVDDRPESDPIRAEAFSQLAAARQKSATALANLNWLLGKPDEQEVSEADAQVSLTKAKLEDAQRKYDQILKDGGPELALAEARLRSAEVQLAEAEADLASLEVKAPFDGVVTEVMVKAGQSIQSGGGLLLLSDPRALMAQVTVVEEDFPLVAAGQAAELFFDALPDEKVTGRVARVVPKRVDGERAIYTLYISLDAIPDKLAAGMTVDTSIVIQRRESVLRLPRAVVRAGSDGTADVEVWANGQTEKREVIVGLRGDSYVEIGSGVNEGEKVVAQ